MNEHLRLVQQTELGVKQPIQAIRAMCPGVELAPFLEEMRLNIMRLKDHWSPAPGPYHLAKQSLRKTKRKDVIDVDEGNRQLANKVNGLLRQLRRHCRK